jgi:hypothetical protein
MMHGDSDDAESALDRDRYNTTDRADEADAPLFHETNEEAYRNASSAADDREADPDTAPSRRDDDLPFVDDPAVATFAGAGAANAAGPGLSGPTVGVAPAEMATGETDARDVEDEA